MITVVIIDDEFNSRDYLNNLIEAYFNNQIHIFGCAQNVREGVELINRYNPDIVFLDVEMPEEKGFMLFENFDKITFEVVFTTAYKQYALSAIKNNAFDYLLKPIDKLDIIALLKKYEKKTHEKNNSTIPIWINNSQNGKPKIQLETLYGIKYLEAFNFVYAKADGSYCKIYTIDGKVDLISKSLKEFEQLTEGYNFFRTHKSYIINLDYVSELIKKDACQILLKNNTIIPLSVRRKNEFLSKIF